MKKPVIILANGNYPKHKIPLKILGDAGSIICCDGAVNKLVEKNHDPHVIIGDLDSINDNHKKKYQKKLHYIPDQNENDLRKAMAWVDKQNIKTAFILGATGKREDHMLGNIFSILQFPTKTMFNMITDFGMFTTIENECKFSSSPGEQISFFSTDPSIKISSTNLKYNLNGYIISDLYSCTLNESIEDNFEIQISHGRIIAYQAFPEN